MLLVFFWNRATATDQLHRQTVVIPWKYRRNTFFGIPPNQTCSLCRNFGRWSFPSRFSSLRQTVPEARRNWSTIRRTPSRRIRKQIYRTWPGYCHRMYEMRSLYAIYRWFSPPVVAETVVGATTGFVAAPKGYFKGSSLQFWSQNIIYASLQRWSLFATNTALCSS